MKTPIFADTAIVELQNTQALELLSADYSYAQYRVTGFKHLMIYLTDHREAGVLAAQERLEGGTPARFASRFNTPAYVIISQAGERGLMIDLYTASEKVPINTLWIGISELDQIPIHDYYFYHLEPSRQGTLTFISVFQNDPEPILMPEPAREYITRC